LRRHVISVHTEEDMPLILVDVSLMKQCIINILHNSTVYTPEGTEIILNAWKQGETEAVIEIRDKGPGVPEDALCKLFNKFYRLPGTRSGGTGLGLTITRAIVEAHGGTITARNHETGGLVISITLTTGDGFTK